MGYALYIRFVLMGIVSTKSLILHRKATTSRDSLNSSEATITVDDELAYIHQLYSVLDISNKIQGGKLKEQRMIIFYYCSNFSCIEM